MVKIFTWGCPVCGREFKSRDEAKEHMETAHGKLDVLSNLIFGPSQWLVGYPTELDEKLSCPKRLLVVGLIVLLLFLLGSLMTWIGEYV